MLNVTKGGIETLVEDWPGRLGYMGLGMAASGAMDNLALQLGNLLVGNPAGEAALEIAGGYFEATFDADHVVAVTGADMSPTVNGQAVPLWRSFRVRRGDAIRFGQMGPLGFRAYLAVAGGIDVPPYLESKSTCVFGSYGGFQGRKLAPGDALAVGKPSASLDALAGRAVKPGVVPAYSRDWVVRAIPGMNTVPDYVTEKGMDFLFGTAFKVSHSSNRSAYRLGQVPPDFFAREDGGQGGSHPSNIVDHGYNMRGAINVCGDTPIVLIADGPTLGGYICVANVINADLWKIGQGRPARDTLKLEYCTLEEAIEARLERQRSVGEHSLV